MTRFFLGASLATLSLLLWQHPEVLERNNVYYSTPAVTTPAMPDTPQMQTGSEGYFTPESNTVYSTPTYAVDEDPPATCNWPWHPQLRADGARKKGRG